MRRGRCGARAQGDRGRAIREGRRALGDRDIESVWITADLFPEDLAAVSGVTDGDGSLARGSESKRSRMPRFPGLKLRPGLPGFAWC